MVLLAVATGVHGLAVAQGLPATRGDKAGTGHAAYAPPASIFDQLSPGGRMIAKSLVWAQGESEFGAGPESREARWSLEKISTARADGLSWGEVFRRMKAEGLVNARTLGEIVNSYYRPVPASTPISASSEPAADPGGLLDAPVITRSDSPTGASPPEHGRMTP